MVMGTWKVTNGDNLGSVLFKSKVIKRESEGSMAPRAVSKSFFWEGQVWHNKLFLELTIKVVGAVRVAITCTVRRWIGYNCA